METESNTIKIYYIGILNNLTKFRITVGDVMSFDQSLTELINNHIDANVDCNRIFQHPSQSFHYHIKIISNIIYCIVYVGSKRMSINCMTTLTSYQNAIMSMNDQKTKQSLEQEFTRWLLHYNDPTNDPLYEVKMKIEDTTKEMHNAVSSALLRGGTISDINDSASLLEDRVKSFNTLADQVKKKVCMENVKSTAIIIMLIIFAVIIIGLFGYGIYKILIV